MNGESGAVGGLKFFMHHKKACDVSIFRKLSKKQFFQKMFSDKMRPFSGCFFNW
jgi:hypothetical protein